MSFCVDIVVNIYSVILLYNLVQQLYQIFDFQNDYTYDFRVLVHPIRKKLLQKIDKNFASTLYANFILHAL